MELDKLLTIVLPVKNEARNILTFLRSVPPDIPLVVVDAGDDETSSIIKTIRTRRTVLLRDPGNIPRARHLGAQIASTPWLLFCDADIEFADFYFHRISSSLLYSDMIYGSKLSRNQHQWYYRSFLLGQTIFDRIGIPAASGSNLLVRRDVYFKIGGFDAGLPVNEDSEIAWRAQRMGYRVRFVKHLAVFSFDHRRLKMGAWNKHRHTLARCFSLYFNRFTPEERLDDRGYWPIYEILDNKSN